MEIVLVYLAIFGAVLFINAFIQGYFGGEMTKKDLIESFFWFIWIPMLLGTITKILVEKYKESKKIKGKK